MSCFFEWHDPTQVNRQGPDIGTQYRTAIFPQSDEQRTEAQQKIDQLNQSGFYSKPIATTIESTETFWPAEDYHQHYLDKRDLGHCGI
jgi:peptide-methionine (S)-S-oxide reductase